MSHMQEIPSTANIVQWNQASRTDGLSHIDRLFNRLQGIYMQKWASQFPNEGVIEVWKETWCEGLAGLNAEQVRRGLNGCANLDWPPSLPEFLRLCIGGEHQLNYENMFHEAAKLAAQQAHGAKVQWPSALLYWSAEAFGWDEIRFATWMNCQKRWTETVDEMRSEEILPPIPVNEALPAPGKRTVTDEEARQKIAQAVSGMRMGGPAKTTDEEFGLNSFNDWIKKAHQAHTKRQTMDAAEAAMKRMGWNEDKIERFKTRYWV